MITDPILEEIWKFRKEYASRFDWNLEAIYRDLKTKEKESSKSNSFGKTRQNAPAKEMH